jgi:ATP-dependent DNA helicase RecQ
LKGKNVLTVMPTGGGKSLCYQLPALILDGTALIVSPLIALMQDQVDSLQRNSIPATFINSSLQFSEIQNRILDMQKGKYKLLYIAPERLESNQFLNLLKSIRLSFLAVDEAHCISEWGHDFRPSYLSIVKTLENIISLPVIALTATATPEVQEDIISVLKLIDTQRFIRGFDRPNLRYITEYSESKLQRLQELLLKNPNGSTIIYCGSRKRVEQFSYNLTKLGMKALPYHAGMRDDIRAVNQDKFLNGGSEVIVATNAFGMGIDKPDVRQVIHTDFTMTLEEYYQEAGRAGRDGLPSDCILIYNNEDSGLQDFFIRNTYPKFEDIKKIYDFLYDIHSISVDTVTDKIIYQSESQIANQTEKPLSVIISILNLFERQGILRRSQTKGLARIKFTTSQERIKEYFNNLNDERKEVLEAILRSVSANAFRELTDFDIFQLKIKYNINDKNYKKSINSFSLARILEYYPPNSAGGIELIAKRKPSDKIPIDFEAYNIRRNNAVNKLNRVREYAVTMECKRNYILNYFNETDIDGVCGKCSGCDSQSIHNGFKNEINLNDFSKLKGKSENKDSYISGKILTNEVKSNDELLEKLISLRDDIASREAISAESFLSIYELKKIAYIMPLTPKSLEEKCGLSRGFIDKYGYAFLEKVKQFKHNINNLSIEKIPLSKESKIIIGLIKEGKKIPEIANKLKLSEGETARFIQESIEYGEKLDRRIFITDELYKIILKMIKTRPRIPLREIREKLKIDIDYPTLRVVTAFARMEIKSIV